MSEDTDTEAVVSSHRRRRSRKLLWAGIALVTLGAILLGYVVWQIFGTTWVAHRTQDRTVDALHQQWRDGEPDLHVDGGTAVAVVRIPSFGATYEVPLIEGVGDAQLAAGIGHFPDAAAPGAVGNFAIAGHRITHGAPLADMPQLEPGDKVVVETLEATYTYTLDSGGKDLEVAFTDTWVIDALPTNPEPGGVEPAQEPRQALITLTTCAELFHTDKRLVAFGHLSKTVPAAQ